MQKFNVTTHKSPVYHLQGCPYLEKAKKENIQFISNYSAMSGKYRPCRFCTNSKNIAFKAQAEKLSRYCRDNEYQYQIGQKELLIQTDVSYWKVLYLPQRETFILFHGNKKPDSKELQMYEEYMYHRQKDVPMKNTLDEYLSYIRSHDQNKKRFHDNLSNLSGRQRITNKNHRKGVTKRVMHLFDQLERQDPSLKQYSFA